MSRVAVCVPCWNQVSYTRWFVESVQRNSRGHDVHLILLDNGSTDETRRYMKSLRRVVVLRNEENEGVNPAWNKLLVEALDERRHSRLDAICLANNDIVVGPHWLDAVTQALADPSNKSYFHANGELTNHGSFEHDVLARLSRGERGLREPARAGWCLFFTPQMVKHFLPIPWELKLWFGDDWIHHKLGEAGYKCEVMRDCFALHFLSKSIEEHPEKVAQVEKDRAAFRARIGEEAFAKLYQKG